MKRLISTLAAASLFAITPATPALAAGGPGDTDVVDRCIAASEAGVFPEETTGNCIALLTTNAIGRPPGWIIQICSFFMKSRPDDFYAAYNSFDECVVDWGDSL